MIHRNLLETVISREGNEAELDIDAGACTLAFSEATEKLSKIKVNGEDVWEADYTNEHKQVSRFQTESEKWINPRVDVALNKTPIWELELNIGAADVNLDLSPFKVKSIDIQSGAASIAVKIGNQHSYTKIDVETGASGIVLHIPKQADCKVVSECFLVSKNLPGFLKHEGVYRTENFGKSAQTVVVEIEGAVSDFQVVRY